ncbi:hypothetical protein QA597_09965 [Marinilabiliaceae bacterium ANBcel2]|nr:hypothetical protein [Marinilabiliaceae bacterium ANBcel2]
MKFSIFKTGGDDTDTIAKLKRKIFIYSVVEVVIVLILIAFGTFLFSITLS